MTASHHLDVLAFAAHPDDVELGAGGTICKLVKNGYRVGIVDLTRGELGSRGTPELRKEEAARAAEIMGIHARENLGLADGDLVDSPGARLRVIEVVRRYRPHVALISAPECRHPDHPNAARLTAHALFYAGLRKIETVDDGREPQEPWRPRHVLHYMQAVPFEPTLIVDVSDEWEQRMRALGAYRSQVYSPDYESASDEPTTFISNPDFLAWISAQARTYGHRIGARFGEPFLYRHGPLGVDDLMAVLGREREFV